MAKTKIIVFLLLLFAQPLVLSSQPVDYSPLKLNVAVILKNPNEQPHTSQRYINYYKQGLEVASYYATQEGIDISNHFYFMTDVMHLPDLAREISSQHPAFIIGPNYSNDFLLLKDYFKDTLVLSAYASDQKISEMPKNFHTFTPLSIEYGQAFANFLAQFYKDANVFTIANAECKACVNLALEIQKAYLKNCHHGKIYIESMTNLSIESGSNIPEIFKEYKQGDVVLMLAQSYGSMIMIERLIHYFKYPMIFIGADNWGSGKDSQIGHLPALAPYTAIHLVPWSLNMETDELFLFKKLYAKKIKNSAPDNISYATFFVVYSVIRALDEFPNSKEMTINQVILQSFLSSIQKNRQKMNERYFAIERLDNADGQGFYMGKISSKAKSCGHV